ncbi:hypothetical protein GCK72_010404 [Caenorhabditis remanei]|uniref:Uncharacterized protein n=1 Tax=Caenorhabditis remanei TaxID=31234 RepID=A0A6A5H6Z5_CAERE|nr:hypothetical protein GCK72_010404 [Caenorhabditis remanei]KAF1762142.1 hypothetical protein GCK72_010404 [Caenorhabditis remanei]
MKKSPLADHAITTSVKSTSTPLTIVFSNYPCRKHQGVGVNPHAKNLLSNEVREGLFKEKRKLETLQRERKLKTLRRGSQISKYKHIAMERSQADRNSLEDVYKSRRQAQLKLSESPLTWTPANSDSTFMMSSTQIQIVIVWHNIHSRTNARIQDDSHGPKESNVFMQEGQAVGTQRMLRFRKTRRNLPEGSRAIEGPAQQINRNLIDRNQKPEELGSQVKNLTVRSQEYLTVRSQEGKNHPSVKEVLPRRSAAMKMVAIHILQSQQSQRTPTGVKRPRQAKG